MEKKIWGSYHRIRTTRKFVKAWEDCLKHDAASPIFYQYVTMKCLKIWLGHNLQEEDYETSTTGINDLEENTLHYMAGYVILINNIIRIDQVDKMDEKGKEK